MPVRIRRVYEPYSAADGQRILIDGLWPRGISKDDDRIGHWMKSLAPSTALRKAFNHQPEKWNDFLKAYHAELDQKAGEINALRALMEKGIVTIVYAAREERFNNAEALKRYLEEKPGP